MLLDSWSEEGGSSSLVQQGTWHRRPLLGSRGRTADAEGCGARRAVRGTAGLPC